MAPSSPRRKEVDEAAALPVFYRGKRVGSAVVTWDTEPTTHKPESLIVIVR